MSADADSIAAQALHKTVRFIFRWMMKAPALGDIPLQAAITLWKAWEEVGWYNLSPWQQIYVRDLSRDLTFGNGMPAARRHSPHSALLRSSPSAPSGSSMQVPPNDCTREHYC